MKYTKYPNDPILFVDDEEQFLLSAEMTMASNRITNTKTCSDSRRVMELLDHESFSLVVLDINMPVVSGLDLLPQIVEKYPDIPVIIISAINDVDKAVDCMKMGALDYMVKPVDGTRLVTTIRKGLHLKEMFDENSRLKEYLLKDNILRPESFSHIITKDSSMRSIFKYIEAIAATPLPILITGETGTGKELIAKAIHLSSGRKGELVPVNVAGVDDQFFSDMLFGHKKGAFTGAEIERKGLIEQAVGGTLFLDEIGDLAMESQVKLLRLLQESQYYPLGSDIPKLSDARIIAATHKDIHVMQENDRFRKDLYYRLKAHQIHIPSLKERKCDINILVNYFLELAAEKLGKKTPTPPKELFTLLHNYNFPGNIRELEGIVFDAVSRHTGGILSMDIFKEKITVVPQSNNTTLHTELNDKLMFTENFPSLREAEQLVIEEALKRSDGNQTIAAELLGMTRRALNNRLVRAKE
ncbi:MAG: sigma-54-dependent Fis family transcriptional regulator [Melioribacteraceae bacterium]|nr:sigma-54-dependent Fis family transcriptional regulator [Melioribacteraceae bacterium]